VEINCQLDATEVFIADLIACSTCFGHHYAHHQELKSNLYEYESNQFFHDVMTTILLSTHVLQTYVLLLVYSQSTQFYC